MGDIETVRELNLQLSERNRILQAENAELRARLAGDDAGAQSWLQVKAHRQRVALDRLCRKVTAQRFRLRLLASLGRDVTYEEYAQAVAALDDRAYAGRIEKQYESV